MVEACRLEVSIAARRNRSRDDAPVIQCRAVARRMHRTVQALVSNEVPDYRGARQHHLRTRLFPYPPIPEADAAGRKLSQLSTRAEDPITK
jgi:hypothetical protein